MNSKFTLVLITAAILLSIGSGVPMGHAKVDTSAGCALLTPEQAQKVLGPPFNAAEETKLIPPFGDKWGSHCTYRSQRGSNIVVDFFVYVTASSTQAKQWFDMGAAVSKPKSKPAIGDAAYIDRDGSIHVLKSNVLYWISIIPGSGKRAEDLAAAVAARI